MSRRTRAAVVRPIAGHGPCHAGAGGNRGQAWISPREREVLQGLLAGLPNKSIAYDLAISPRMVEIHRARVMDKMGARSLSELIRMSLAAGLQPQP